jgi:DME family drug/metabolite transporter
MTNKSSKFFYPIISMLSINSNANFHWQGIAAIVVAATLWSTGGLFIKLLPFDAFTILFYRSACASLLFGLVYRQKAFIFNRRVALAAFFYMTLLVAFVSAVKLTTAANAIFLQYSAPIYVLIAEPLLFKTRLERINILTIAACLLGMALFFSGGLQSGAFQGDLIAAFSGIMLAGLLLAQRANNDQEQVSAIFWGNIAVAAVGFSAFMASPAPTPEQSLMLGFLGFVQIGLGYLLFTYGLRYTLAIESALLAMIEPILTPIWVWLGHGEQPSQNAIIGGLLIVLALAAKTIWTETKKI